MKTFKARRQRRPTRVEKGIIARFGFDDFARERNHRRRRFRATQRQTALMERSIVWPSLL